MSIRSSRRLAALMAVTSALALSACSAGSLGSSDEEGTTTVSYLVDNEASTVKTAEALASAFNAKSSAIQVKVETRPQGGEGDNLVKTRLSTGDMTDVFQYNSGSLFQALAPQTCRPGSPACPCCREPTPPEAP